MSRADKERFRSKVAKAVAKQAAKTETAIPVLLHHQLPSKSARAGFAIGLASLAFTLLGMGYPVMFPRPNVYIGSLFWLGAVFCFIFALWVWIIRWKKKTKIAVAAAIITSFAAFDYLWFIRSYHGPFCFGMLARESTNEQSPLRLTMFAQRSSVSTVSVTLEKLPSDPMEADSLSDLTRNWRSTFLPIVYEGAAAPTNILIDPKDSEYQLQISTPEGLFLEHINLSVAPWKQTLDVVTIDGRSVFHEEVDVGNKHKTKPPANQ